MMTRAERAKQFMPFDAMKGLQEALRAREERFSRVERKELSDEAKEILSRNLSRLNIGDNIEVEYFCNFHYIVKIGKIEKTDKLNNLFILDGDKIFFEDIYRLERKK